MADNYLENLLQKATTIAKTSSTDKLKTKQPEIRTNLVPLRKGIIETNNAFRPNKEAVVKYGLKGILKQAEAYDPFAVVNKTEEQMKEPFSYFQNQAAMIKPSQKNYIVLPTKITYLWRDMQQRGILNRPDLFWQGGNTWMVDSDPHAEYNKQNLSNLISNQSISLGSQLQKLDTKILATTDWTNFNKYAADIEGFKSIRKSYMDKFSNPNYDKTQLKADFDWIKSYEDQMFKTYGYMEKEIASALKAGKSTYDIKLATKNTNIDAIKALMPNDKLQTRKVLDIGNENQRDLINNRVKKVNKLTDSKYKPTPVFENRPS